MTQDLYGLRRDVVEMLKRLPSEYESIALAAIKVLRGGDSDLTDLEDENKRLRAELVHMTRRFYAAREGRDLVADRRLQAELRELRLELNHKVGNLQRELSEARRVVQTLRRRRTSARSRAVGAR